MSVLVRRWNRSLLLLQLVNVRVLLCLRDLVFNLEVKAELWVELVACDSEVRLAQKVLQ